MTGTAIVVLALGITAPPVVIECGSFPGANAGARITACLAAFPREGGIADARIFSGEQIVAQDMFGGVTARAHFLLGAATFDLSATQAPPSHAQIIGMGRSATLFSIAHPDLTAFAFALDVSGTVLRGLGIEGRGMAHTVPCVTYTSSFDNTIDDASITKCAVGIRYARRSPPTSSSSYANFIRNAFVSSYHAVNIDARAETNALTLQHVTFGGGGSRIGIRVADASDFKITGGVCEGVTITCIDLDMTDLRIVNGGHMISGVHFEENRSSGGGIRVGNTATVNGVTITGNAFLAGPGSAPILGTATNVSSLTNWWQTGRRMRLGGGTPSLTGSGTLHAGSSDLAGKVTATAAGAPSLRRVFSRDAWANAPACHASNETRPSLVLARSSATAVDLSGTVAAGDVLAYTCSGY